MQIFVTFSLTRRQPACARTTADKGGKKQTKKGRRNGARSRRIIKCVLPRKFIFILESIIRKRRHARTRERKRERETFLPLFARDSRFSPRSSRYKITRMYSLRVLHPSFSCIPTTRSERKAERIHRRLSRLHFEINCYALIHT